jgi:hypothetical protein
MAGINPRTPTEKQWQNPHPLGSPPQQEPTLTASSFPDLIPSLHRQFTPPEPPMNRRTLLQSLASAPLIPRHRTGLCHRLRAPHLPPQPRQAAPHPRPLPHQRDRHLQAPRHAPHRLLDPDRSTARRQHADLHRPPQEPRSRHRSLGKIQSRPRMGSPESRNRKRRSNIKNESTFMQLTDFSPKI